MMGKCSMRRRTAIVYLVVGVVFFNILFLLRLNRSGGIHVSSMRYSFHSLQEAVHIRVHAVTATATHNNPEPVRNTTVIPVAPTIQNAVNPHNFKWVINPTGACPAKSEVELIMAVPATRHKFHIREVIMKTWGSYAYNKTNKAILLFFVGSGNANEPPDVQKRILNESKTFNYIVQEDFIDSYKNLSLKTVSILKWVSTFCPQAKYLLKIDDDIYANIHNLIKWMRQQSKTSTDYITGAHFVDFSPIRNKKSKWYASEIQYPGRRYPDFTSGTTYAMTVSAAKRLYLASLQTPLFWLEDVYITGLCAKRENIKIIGCPMIINHRAPVSGCEFRKRITGHQYLDWEMIKIHKELYDPNLKCRNK